MEPGLVDPFNRLIDSLGSLPQYSGHDGQVKLAAVRRSLIERITAIETSRDPLTELVPVMMAGASQSDPMAAQDHLTPQSSDPGSALSAAQSSLIDVMRHQINALTEAQLHVAGYHSPMSPQLYYSPRAHSDHGGGLFSQPASRPESARQSDSTRVSELREPDECRSQELSQPEPIPIGTATPPLHPGGPLGSVTPVDPASPTVAELDIPTCDYAPAGTYKTLSHVREGMKDIDLYVVALEMVRPPVRNLMAQRDVMNYRAIDPTVYGTPLGDDIDYSVQILSPNNCKQFHVNFGDVIRLKRVNAELKVDKAGKKHINIIMSLRNFPSMRIWPNKSCSIAEGQLGPPFPGDGDADADVDGSSESSAVVSAADTPEPANELEALASEAEVIYSGVNTRVEHEDKDIIMKLRSWVGEKLDAIDLTVNHEFTKDIASAAHCLNDFIVCVLEVAPQPEVNLIVSDESSMAVVTGLKDALVANLIESHNHIKPGEWLKLRAVQRLGDMFKCADGTSYPVLRASQYSCATRLPQCDRPYSKPIPATSARSRKARRVTRMKMWNSVSNLNRSFPKHLFGSTGYVDRLLQFNCGEEGEFERVPQVEDDEVEEGEIKATPQ